MSDIKDRLREMADLFEAQQAPGNLVLALRAGADEIDRLRAKAKSDCLDYLVVSSQAIDLMEENDRLRAGGCARDQSTTQYCAEAAALAAENERLRAAQQWLPIERAPRDGTAIIGAAYWTMADGVYRLGWMAEGYLDGDRWSFASFDLDEDEFSLPTHWMPLPAPPALTSEKEEGNG